MSVIASISVRSKESDYIFLATDAVSVFKPKDLEFYHSLTSKSLYYPHIKTSVSVLGTEFLSNKTREFINNQVSIQNIDELIASINKNFIDEAFADNIFPEFVLDEDSPDFWGSIVLCGTSYYKSYGEDMEEKRERPLLMIRKIMVYKNEIKDCGWIVPEIDDFEGNTVHTVHPTLSNEITDSIFNRNKDILERDFFTGFCNVLIDFCKEHNKNYIQSQRKTLVCAGEVHITVFSLSRNDTYGEGLSVTHLSPYRFEDFEDVMREIETLEILGKYYKK